MDAAIDKLFPWLRTLLMVKVCVVKQFVVWRSRLFLEMVISNRVQCSVKCGNHLMM